MNIPMLLLWAFSNSCNFYLFVLFTVCRDWGITVSVGGNFTAVGYAQLLASRQEICIHHVNWKLKCFFVVCCRVLMQNQWLCFNICILPVTGDNNGWPHLFDKYFGMPSNDVGTKSNACRKYVCFSPIYHWSKVQRSQQNKTYPKNPESCLFFTNILLK